MRKFTLYAFVLLGTLAFASCGKDGATGPQGETGATGAQGEKGDSGTANVIYSEWLNLGFTGDVTSAGDSIWYTGFEVPQLTADWLASGTVMVYANLGTADDPAIVSLPYFSVYNSVNIMPILLTGGIEIDANTDVSTGYDDDGNIILQYRYVLIPGGTAARSAVDWKDYNKVKAYLHLKD